MQAVGNTGVFQTIGQALVSVFSGQGIGQLQEQIANLANNNQQVIDFFNGLLGVLLTVREGITGQLVPAFENLGSVIANIASNADFVGFFSRVAAVSQVVIDVVERVINKVAEFIAKIAAGGPEADNLKNTLTGLATAISTTLIGAFVATVGPMLIVINILQQIGQAALDQIGNIDRFASAFELATTVIKNAMGNLLSDFLPKTAVVAHALELITTGEASFLSGDTEGAARAADQLGQLGQAWDQANAKQTAYATIGSVGREKALSEQQAILDQLKEQRDATQGALQGEQNLANSSARGGAGYLEHTNNAKRLSSELSDLNAKVATQELLVTAIQGPSNDYINALSNMAAAAQAEAAKIQEALDKGLDVQPLLDKANEDAKGLVKFFVDAAGAIRTTLNTDTGAGSSALTFPPGKDKAQQALDDAQRETEAYNTRLDALATQFADRQEQIETQKDDRLVELQDSAKQRRADIIEQTNRQVENLNRNFDQQQSEKKEDRSLQQSLQNNQRAWQEYFQTHRLLTQSVRAGLRACRPA